MPSEPHHLRPGRQAGLRGAHRQRHRQRAEDQDRRVEGAPADRQVVAGFLEGLRRRRAVDDVGHEQAAEEHDFGDQEHPHAERRRLDLLLHVVEVVLQLRMDRVLVVDARLNGVHVGHQGRLVNRTWKMLGVSVRQGRPPGSGHAGACPR